MCAKKNTQPAYDTKVKPRLDEIGQWFENGASMKDAADKLGISERSLFRYANRYEELRRIMDACKPAADDQVEYAFFKSCIGFSYTETQTTYDDSGEVIKQVVTEKYVPPNGNNCIRWLVKRRPDQWAANAIQEGTGGGIIQIPAIDSAAYEMERAAELKRLEEANG